MARRGDGSSRFGTRSMFNTIAGLLPVIAVTRKRQPWLQGMVRRHRVEASMTKPISREALRHAFQRIEKFHDHHALDRL